MRIAVLAVPLALMLSGCSDMLCGAPAENSASLQRFGPAVRDDKQALRIARAVWRSMSTFGDEDSEDDWMRNFKAERRFGVWYVHNATVGLGGGLAIYISPKDGRIIDIAFEA